MQSLQIILHPHQQHHFEPSSCKGSKKKPDKRQAAVFLSQLERSPDSSGERNHSNGLFLKFPDTSINPKQCAQTGDKIQRFVQFIQKSEQYQIWSFDMLKEEKAHTFTHKGEIR